MENRIKIVTWKDATGKLPRMENIESLPDGVYNPVENSKHVARLIMTCLPGNTNDEVFGAIAAKIKDVIDNCHPQDVSTMYLKDIIRIALNQLGEVETE